MCGVFWSILQGSLFEEQRGQEAESGALKDLTLQVSGNRRYVKEFLETKTKA